MITSAQGHCYEKPLHGGRKGREGKGTRRERRNGVKWNELEWDERGK